MRAAIEAGHFVRSVDNPAARGTLVWIHGLGDSGLCFEHLMTAEAVSAWSHRAWDLPGYGRGERPPAPRTLPQQADFIAERCAELAPGPIVVVGHSMGGIIGLLLCERFPELARGFVNVEGNVSIGDCTYSGRAAGVDVATFVEHGYPRLLREMEVRGKTDLAQGRYAPSLALADARAFHRNGCELVELSRGEELARRQAALGVPNLYVQGIDGAGPHSRALLDAAGVAVERIEPAGHWPFIDQPERFLEVLGAFLRGLDGA